MDGRNGMKSVGTADWLVLLGLLLIGAALWFLVGWAGVLAWCGFLLLSVGVAEARKARK